MTSGPARLNTSNGPLTGTRALSEAELQRKRARDRKAQQAMRDRNKWTINSQLQAINHLTESLAVETARNNQFETKIRNLENENDSLRTQMATSCLLCEFEKHECLIAQRLRTAAQCLLCRAPVRVAFLRP